MLTVVFESHNFMHHQHTYTHTHTPPVLLMWIMDKMQRSDTFGWVSELEGITLYEALRRLPATVTVLHSAALCCLFRELQLHWGALERSWADIRSVLDRFPPISNTSTLWPVSLLFERSSEGMRKSLPLSFWALQNQHNKTPARGIISHRHTNTHTHTE